MALNAPVGKIALICSRRHSQNPRCPADQPLGARKGSVSCRSSGGGAPGTHAAPFCRPSWSSAQCSRARSAPAWSPCLTAPGTAGPHPCGGHWSVICSGPWASGGGTAGKRLRVSGARWPLRGEEVAGSPSALARALHRVPHFRVGGTGSWRARGQPAGVHRCSDHWRAPLWALGHGAGAAGSARL